MMLLSITTIVEPDRQRFARFAIDAVSTLGGNIFSATATLDAVLKRLRADLSKTENPFEVRLEIDDNKLYVRWQEVNELLALMQESPPANVIAELTERLKQASEATDTELLQLRNQKITEDLERAKQRAASEMAGLEAALETKKTELQESIHLAETDSLTGLLNRGAYDNRLQQAILRCRRQNEALCLLLLDLDKFKEINDTHGHQYGDEYLKRMAEAMRAVVREHVDFPCRMGGDEFAIVLFADMAIAKRVATNLLKRMESRVSIGIAQASVKDEVKSLVATADAALYEAKHRGRGQFVAADGVSAVEVATSTRTEDANK